MNTPMNDYTHTFEWYEELTEFLRYWCNWGDTPMHDRAGMMMFLCACLDNLIENTRTDKPGEYDLTEEQRTILKKLAEIPNFSD